MIYLIPIILTLVGLHRYSTTDVRNRDNLYWIICLSIILIFGLRYRVGGDTIHYMQLYDATPALGDGIWEYALIYFKEPGILFLFSAVKRFCDSFYIVQLCHVAFVNIVVFFFLKENTRNKYLSVLLYFFLFAFYYNTEIIKESVALCFALLGYRSLNNGKLIQYYLFAVAALLFHVSALFLLFVPLLLKTKIKVVYLMILFLVVSLFGNFILSNVISLFGTHIFDRIMYASEYQLGNYGKWWNFMKTAVIVLYVYHLSVQSKSTDQYNLKLLKLACAFGALTISEYAGFYRILNYFYPILIVCISNYLENLKKSSSFSLNSIILAVMLFVFFMLPYLKDTSDKVPNTHYYCLWFPYYSIMDEQIDANREAFIIRNFE